MTRREQRSRRKRSNKNQRPKRLGSPIKRSVKEISTEEDIADLNQIALEAYGQKLAYFKTETVKPMETRLGLLERHLFLRKFGYAALDISSTWDAKWKVQLNLERKN